MLTMYLLYLPTYHSDLKTSTSVSLTTSLSLSMCLSLAISLLEQPESFCQLIWNLLVFFIKSAISFHQKLRATGTQFFRTMLGIDDPLLISCALKSSFELNFVYPALAPQANAFHAA